MTTTTTTVTNVEAAAVRDVERYTREIGPSECVRRFLRCYSKVRVQRTYTMHLLLYFRWLHEQKNGMQLSPDELVVDNLRCIYRSEPEDVSRKRKHRALLEDYLNQELGRFSESHKRLAMAAVKGFYERNDSPLFGKVSIAEQQAVVPDRALKAEDIRQVLRALRAEVLVLLWPLLLLLEPALFVELEVNPGTMTKEATITMTMTAATAASIVGAATPLRGNVPPEGNLVKNPAPQL